MENATKALLIAAAVLIAIVLVALGVNLLGSTGDTTEDAGKVAEQIGSSTSSAVSSLGTALGKLDGGAEEGQVKFYVSYKDNIYTFKWPAGCTAKEVMDSGKAGDQWGVDEHGQLTFLENPFYVDSEEKGNNSHWKVNPDEFIPKNGETYIVI